MVRQYLKSKIGRNTVCAAALFISLFAVLFCALPIFSEVRPYLQELTPSVIPDVLLTEEETFLTLTGDNLERVDFLYIDGEMIEFTKVYDRDLNCFMSSTELYIRLDPVYYMGKDSITIQVARDMAGIYKLKSNSLRVQIKEEDKQFPQITAVSCTEILRPSADLDIEITGTGITEDTRVFLNGTKAQDFLTDPERQNIRVDIPKELIAACPGQLEISLVQYYEGKLRTCLKSETVKIPVLDVSDETLKLQKGWSEKYTRIFKITEATEAEELNRETLYKAGIECIQADLEYNPDGLLAVQTGDGWFSFRNLLHLLQDMPKLYLIAGATEHSPIMIRNMCTDMIQICGDNDCEKLLDKIVILIHNREECTAAAGLSDKMMLSPDNSFTDGSDIAEFLSDTGIDAVSIEAGSRWTQEELWKDLSQQRCFLYIEGAEEESSGTEYMEDSVYGMVIKRSRGQ